jgi:rhamnosyltransferase subunit B
VPALFAEADQFVTVLPELDPYRQHRLQPAVGPLDPPLAPVAAPAEPSFFAYLSAKEAGIGEVLSRLSAEVRGEVYLRELPAAMRTQLRAAGVNVLDRPPPLREALARASVVLHHGSLGTAQAGLTIGRPQVSLPQHLEHGLTSHLLQRMGVGRQPDVAPAAVRDAVLASLDDESARRAATVAGLIAAREPVGSLPAIVRRCVELSER